ncbi:uncharacterized protein LOC133034260 [Cannabis sativa]|uniref:uncharacterized protein LOC133034260 n=1 Tax=Cannabis sativa TaxID=3483 RepID=UPI0029C9C4E3|nr:uncharacterized protein LOC133034260 [Cannabis sativa]
MKILAWNCRGLGSSTTVRQLTALIRHHKPEMLLIAKARIPLQKFNLICKRLHFEEVVYVPPVGLSGGLGLCWMKGVKCNITSYHKYGILGEISSDPPGVQWNFFGLYGPPHEKDKETFWKEVGDFALTTPSPLLLMGDMNGTLCDAECINYARRSNSARYAFDFRRMVDRAGLIDLGFIGPSFTWVKSSKQPADGKILFPDAVLNHLSASSSDHRPILLDTHGGYKGKRRPFRYENMWVRDPRCYWVVKEAWAKRLHDNPMEALLREEIHWRQKSRIKWIKEGDRCSKFFMTSTIVRRRKNFIQCIKDSDGGQWIRDQKEIAECFLKNFQDLFRQDHNCLTPQLSNLFDRVITHEENMMLNAIPNPDEVTAAINEMGNDKAPGPDGFPVSFYSHQWDTIGNDLYELVIHFFTHYDLPPFINDTSIVLIPKRDNPVHTRDY